MTRNFNKQQQDDERPSFRNKPSNNKYGEERPSRPARPRLNRETVDRAWESGAQTQHHDYHPRTQNGQPTRNGQPINNRYSDSRDTTNGHRPYGNRPEGRPPYGNRSDTDRPPYGNRPEGRPPYSNRSDTDRPPYGNRSEGRPPYSNRSDTDRPPYGNRSESRPPYGNRSEGRPPYGNRSESRPPYGNRSEGRPPYGNRTENDRPPYGNRSESRPPYGNRPDDRDRDNHSSDRPYDRSRPSNYRGSGPQDESRQPSDSRFSGPPRERRDGNFRGNDRSYQPRPENGRGQDRPFNRQEPKPFREDRRAASRDESREHVSRGRYEGDYEGIEEKRPPTPRPEPYFRNAKPRRPAEEEVEEKHVTRMEDGRVLKGPRPAQRKNAQFWNEVNSETESLVNQVHVIDNQAEVEAEEQLLTTLDKLAAATPESTAKVSDTVTEPVSAPSVTIPELVSATTETIIETVAVTLDAGIEASAVTPDVVTALPEVSTRASSANSQVSHSLRQGR
jgi:hypothetical protein